MKMLLELNEREGMTMVFVTHDVNIKNYAHRVVRMRDGKIASIETIPEKLRQQAKEHLLRELGETGPSRVTVDSAEPVAPEKPAWSATEIRQPRDYGYIGFPTGKKPFVPAAPALAVRICFQGEIRVLTKMARAACVLAAVADRAVARHACGFAPQSRAAVFAWRRCCGR